MLNILNKINPILFFISFTIGLFMCYITNPKPNLIIKYPTPENSGKIIYKDNADMCYKYKSTEIDCPNDKNKIIENPIQDNIYN